MQGDGHHEHDRNGCGRGKADEDTDLTQVSSARTVQSDQTVVPTTGVDRQASINNSNSKNKKQKKQQQLQADMTRSRASSTSIQAHHTRSTSSSTAGNSSTGRHRRRTHSRPTASSSMHGQQPTSPASIRSSAGAGAGAGSMSPQKREQLIALHRESCRLFQDPPQPTTTVNYPIGTLARSNSRSTAGNSSSIITSPAASPILQSQRSHSYSIPAGLAYDHDHDHDHDHNHNHDIDVSDEDLLAAAAGGSDRHSTQYQRYPFRQQLASAHGAEEQDPDPDAVTAAGPFEPPLTVVPPATITEWTSPSTRRREYEKIDRNNRGLRGLWRRWTPSCLHAGDTRVPFFEETTTTKRKDCAGSVRRFRMDIPDDDDDLHEKGMQVKTRTTATAANKGMVAGPKVEKGRWSCF